LAVTCPIHLRAGWTNWWRKPRLPSVAQGQHPFPLIKQQFGFEKTRLRGMVKNRCKVNVPAALTNLLLARRQLLATP
jgi:IS5 family transposase